MSDRPPADEALSKLLRASLALVALALLASVAFVAIEGWDFSRALYFTLITLTTVGSKAGASRGEPRRPAI